MAKLIESIKNFVNTKASNASPRGKIDSEYVLETKDLGITFGGLKAAQNVNLKIKKNEIYGLIGPNGAGKTTVFNLLTGVYQPTYGSFYLCGEELRGLPQDKINHKGIARTFQNIRLFNNMTVVRNVMVGLANQPEYKCSLFTSLLRLPAHFRAEKAMRERAKELLKIFGLEDERNNLACNLPYGKQRKLEIARALATEPKVLLCDEATSALDPNTTAGVLALLKDINERLGITIVVITHEMSVIQEICDRVSIIDGGLIAEEGTVEEIFRNPKTQIGKELVLHEGENREAYTGKLPNCYRLVFKGGSENEPVLGRMMIETKGVANILAANTRTIDAQSFGQMVLQFPEEKELRETMIQYLRDRGVVVEEVEYV